MMSQVEFPPHPSAIPKTTNPLLHHLIQSFSHTPIPHPLTITLLTSHSKQTRGLFPFAVDAPKCWVKQLVVVVAADVKEGGVSANVVGLKTEKGKAAKAARRNSVESGRGRSEHSIPPPPTRSQSSTAVSSSPITTSTSNMRTRSQSRTPARSVARSESPLPVIEESNTHVKLKLEGISSSSTTSALDPAVSTSSPEFASKTKDEAKTHTRKTDDRVHGHGHEPKRIILCALEAYVYTIPSTSSTIIYISKVDSTGYSPISVPPPIPSSSGQTHPTNPTAPSTPLTQPRLPPTTRTLLTSFLSYYLHRLSTPTRNVHVQLFARSQNQYLFPNSILGGAKKVGGGARLCAWWRGVLEDVVIEVLAAARGLGRNGLSVLQNDGTNAKQEDGASQPPHSPPTAQQPSQFAAHTLKLTHLLPSYDALEARALLGPSKRSLPEGVRWSYGPPNAPEEIGGIYPYSGVVKHDEAGFNAGINGGGAQEQPLQTKMDGNGLTQPDMDGAIDIARRNIARLIPVFEDDPKARFLYEIVQGGGGGTGAGKHGKATGGINKGHDGERDAKRRKVDIQGKGESSAGPRAGPDDLEKQDTDEFARRRDRSPSTALPADAPIRAESSKPPTHNGSIAIAQREKRKLEAFNLRCEDERALEQVAFDKFWELIGYRQECASGDVTGFFSLSKVSAYPEGTAVPEILAMLDKEKERIISRSAERWEVSTEVFARLLASLLNYDFANRDLAIVSSGKFLGSIRNILGKEIGVEATESGCFGRVEGNDLKVESRSVQATNGSSTGGGEGPSAPVGQPINVLQVRKKQKKPTQE